MTLRPTGWRLPALLVAVTGALALLVATATAATPTVTTLPIEDPTLFVTDDYALLSGVINPNGDPTVYKFQYGETTDYGSETPTTAAGNGKAEVPVDVAVEDLKPSTTYHYRLVAFPDPAQSQVYGVAETAGEDQTFTTYASTAVAFAGKRAKVAKGKAQVRLTATGVPEELARGRVTLRTRLGKKTKKIGSAAYRITVGKTKTIKVRLSRKAKRTLARRGSLKAKAAARTKGVAKRATATLTLS
jgi:hypothetical protein